MFNKEQSSTQPEAPTNIHSMAQVLATRPDIANFIKAANHPFDYGYEEGCRWVRTASIEAIHEAATRLTSQQQLKKFLDLYNQRFIEGEEDPIDGCPCVIYPTFHDVIDEIRCYFEEIRDSHFFFEDWSDDTDEQVCSVDGSFFYSEIPNRPFRDFESGWSAAVRERYLSVLKSM